jgi:hypothetical protein
MYQSLIQVVKVPTTKYYFFGVGVGFAIFVLILGWRFIVLLTGSAIALTAIVYWFWKTSAPSISPSHSFGLLQASIFLEQLDYLQPRIPATHLNVWSATQAQAINIQINAEQIALRESLLIPDLLETLHSTLDLSEQIADTLHLLDQMGTPEYQARTQQQLQRSLARLEVTHTQMQGLNDQFACEQLEQRSHFAPALASGLRVLISENNKVCE